MAFVFKRSRMQPAKRRAPLHRIRVIRIIISATRLCQTAHCAGICAIVYSLFRITGDSTVVLKIRSLHKDRQMALLSCPQFHILFSPARHRSDNFIDAKEIY